MILISNLMIKFVIGEVRFSKASVIPGTQYDENPESGPDTIGGLADLATQFTPGSV
jgi:hypothetical protein